MARLMGRHDAPQGVLAQAHVGFLVGQHPRQQRIQAMPGIQHRTMAGQYPLGHLLGTQPGGIGRHQQALFEMPRITTGQALPALDLAPAQPVRLQAGLSVVAPLAQGLGKQGHVALLIGQVLCYLPFEPGWRLRQQLIEQRTLGGVFTGQVHAQQQAFASRAAVQAQQGGALDAVHQPRLQRPQALGPGHAQAVEVGLAGNRLPRIHCTGCAALAVAVLAPCEWRCQARIRPIKLSRMKAVPLAAAPGKLSSWPL
ncbi:hypothetical protein PBOI14_45470 [Pseudomonas sp. Boi14]|nr:hypothetical protein PBOI14_45470 [Pseudomonas sp. Boi14]